MIETSTYSTINLAYIFLKIGMIFWGGGQVLIPVIQRELVSNLHLLSQRQFIDGIAISQITPGPVAIIATFAGYIINGVKGALVSTFTMFLPGVILMTIISKNYERIKNSNRAKAVLNAVIPVIIGLLISTCIQLGTSAIRNIPEIAILIASFIAIAKYKINPAIIIVTSAAIGILFRF